MSEYIPLKITFKLENGYFKPSNMPFDGILANVYFERMKQKRIFDGNYEQDLPFLKKTAGAYHISNPIYSPQFVTNLTFFKKFDLDLFIKIGDNKQITKAVENPISGRYKGFVVENELINTDEVVVYACGDFDGVADILEDVRFIGKKAALGWGKVRSISIEEIDNDYSMIKDGIPMRHLPDIAPFNQLDNMAKVIMPLSHPYWKKSKDVSLMYVGGGR